MFQLCARGMYARGGLAQNPVIDRPQQKHLAYLMQFARHLSSYRAMTADRCRGLHASTNAPNGSERKSHALQFARSHLLPFICTHTGMQA